MDSKKSQYHINLVYDRYAKDVHSVTPPKFVLQGGIPIMRLTTPEGTSLGVNLNFVHRFEYNATNEEKESKTNEQGNS